MMGRSEAPVEVFVEAMIEAMRIRISYGLINISPFLWARPTHLQFFIGSVRLPKKHVIELTVHLNIFLYIISTVTVPYIYIRCDPALLSSSCGKDRLLGSKKK